MTPPETPPSTETQQASFAAPSGSAKCLDCGIPYPFGLDLVLPDQQWKWIAPNDGLLCANCIAKRADQLKGATVLLAWIDRIDWSAPRPAKWFSPDDKKTVNYGHNPEHTIATCGKCGAGMVYNVPRLGPSGGYVHKETGSFKCGNSPNND